MQPISSNSSYAPLTSQGVELATVNPGLLRPQAENQQGGEAEEGNRGVLIASPSLVNFQAENQQGGGAEEGNRVVLLVSPIDDQRPPENRRRSHWKRCVSAIISIASFCLMSFLFLDKDRLPSYAAFPALTISGVGSVAASPCVRYDSRNAVIRTIFGLLVAASFGVGAAAQHNATDTSNFGNHRVNSMAPFGIVLGSIITLSFLCPCCPNNEER